jgi:hypothetical protein
MAGPFDSYVEPGVYTKTESETQTTPPPAGLQIPVFIGTGKETLRRTDYELVRGSSSNVDQLITEEDVSDRFVVDDTNPDDLQLGTLDGQTNQFKVQNLPIVRGDGNGRTSNRPQDVSVTVNGTEVAVESVDGSEGLITLQVPPAVDSTVLVTYHFNRTDTLTTDDLSDQVSDHTALLQGDEPESYSITQGVNDLFRFAVDGDIYEVVLQSGNNRTANQIVQDIQSLSITGLNTSVDENNQGENRVQLESNGSLRILDGTANSVLGFVQGESTDRNREFYTFDGPIVDGTNGGIVTNNTSDVTVEVDGNQVDVNLVDGSNSRVVLDQAPPVGSTVTITYHFNSFQDTFDYLPDSNIRSVDRVGVAPGRNDYSQGSDYIIRDGRILWGTAIDVVPGITTPGSEPFDDDNEISASLRGDQIFFEQVSRFNDLGINSDQEDIREIALGRIPTEGDGRDIPTSDTSKVHIYHGDSLSQARSRGEVEIRRIDPEDRRVVVEDPIPAQDQIFATYFYNRLRDDIYTVTKQNSGGVTIESDLRGASLYNVRFGTSSATDSIQWPSGVQTEPDAFVQNATNGVDETVTVSFTTTDEGQAAPINNRIDPYDIFPNQSDHFAFNDSDNGVTSDSIDPVDLNQSAFGVIVSDPFSSGSSFNPTVGTDANFEFEHQGTDYSVDLTTASGSTISDIVEPIWRAVPNETEVQGSTTEDFDLSTTQDFDIDVNGTNVQSTITGTASDSASDVESTLETELSNQGLTVGDITDPANDVDVIANSDGTVSIVAAEELTINDASSQPNDPLEATLGWDTGTLPNDDSVGTYTLGNTLENTKIARTWEGSAREYILLRTRDTAANPAQADDYQIRTLTGNANGLLGFDDFQNAFAAESAVNKGATVVSDTITGTDITNLAAEQEDFVVFVDGTEFTVSGSSFSGVTTLSGAATVIDTALGSSGTAVEEPSGASTPGNIRITSATVDDTSSVEIGDGPSNAYLAFDEGQSGGQRKASASEITAVLNNESAAWADNSTGSTDLSALTSSGEVLNAAYVESIDEEGYGDYIELRSFGVGDDVDITVDEPSTDSVLNDTGIGFTVSSTNSNGSSGTGVVGQTYVDDNTTLTFTVREPSDGDYQNGDSFTLIVESDMNVGPSIPNKSIPGVNMTVSNIGAIPTDDSAEIQTFDKSGDEPDIGDFYYITYDYLKDDFSSRLFTQFGDIQDEYGELATNNPLTLASYLASLNGAQVIATKQVETPSGSSQATQQAYFDAIEDLNAPIQSGISPDIIVPLTTDEQVQARAVQNAEIQSSQRFGNERRVILGMPSGALPEDARQRAESFDSFRAVLVYPDSAVITLTDSLGNETSQVVDGRYIAAAMAGSAVSPAFDVASPWTNRDLVGFDRLVRDLNDIERNRLATSGVTVLEEEETTLSVRQGLTTNTDNVFTKTPSVVAIRDFVQQQTRAALDQFIGLKNLRGRAQDIEAKVNGLLKSLVESDIIVDFTAVSATPDQQDPTQINVKALYSPVFPVLYIPVEFTLTSSSVQ